MSHDVLKLIQTRLANLKSKLETLIGQRNDLNKEINRTQNDIQKNELEQKHLLEDSKKPIVTEHAIIRYLERVYKMDIEKIESEILTPDVETMIQTLKSGRFHKEIADIPFTIVFKEKVVTTILPREK
ncbi:MAG: hypothetical protein PHF86_12625 [Candidatus Nanoarchaeia archaeon]|jgi:hypothetical protein|nr:hypothetical protein [Candidatus Nanoarchaeia archaeon]